MPCGQGIITFAFNSNSYWIVYKIYITNDQFW